MRSRLRKAFGDGLWGFLGAALSADEKSRVGVWRYGASGEYRDAPQYDWEDAWLGRWLPAAPARVLVGAAGAGREAASLVARGYTVTALEPSTKLAALCQSRVPAARVLIGRYEDLARTAPRRSDGRTAHAHDRFGEPARFPEATWSAERPGEPARFPEATWSAERPGEPARFPEATWSAERPFDAVLMGLGSLSHLLDGGDRAAVMRALASLCPAGPVLASAVAPPRSGIGVWAPGRAMRLGRALATPVRVLRRLPAMDPREVAFGGLGFAKLFVRDELRAIGEALGRDTVFEEERPDGMELCAWPAPAEGPR